MFFSFTVFLSPMFCFLYLLMCWCIYVLFSFSFCDPSRFFLSSFSLMLVRGQMNIWPWLTQPFSRYGTDYVVTAIAPLSHVGWRTLTTSASSLGQSSARLFTLVASWLFRHKQTLIYARICPNFSVFARPEIIYEEIAHQICSCCVTEVTPPRYN